MDIGGNEITEKYKKIQLHPLAPASEMELFFASVLRTYVVLIVDLCYNIYSNRVSGWFDLSQ